ncbi:CsiV family protein [Oceanospirillum sediminis]|uniref:Uncharacterized protein n=1 Tax=Oceanospirillum sediminis TaxID=2760088 RepID=A0A839IQI9_9GAMM|nr:hypothetical protein [Oceanospirillum sediminis]
MTQTETHKTLRVIAWLTTLILASTPLTATANNEGRRYIAELLVFSYENKEPGLSEKWRENQQIELPSYYQALYKRSDIRMSELDSIASQPVSAAPTGLAPLSGKQIRALKNGTTPEYFIYANHRHLLNGQANRLKRNGDHRILFHESWHMTARGKGKSLPIRIRGGQRFGNQYELDGTISISIARYLHVSTNLYLSEFSATETADGQRSFRTSQVIPMKQTRKMRSRELHYIDHPAFGILVRFTPM